MHDSSKIIQEIIDFLKTVKSEYVFASRDETTTDTGKKCVEYFIQGDEDKVFTLNLNVYEE